MEELLFQLRYIWKNLKKNYREHIKFYKLEFNWSLRKKFQQSNTSNQYTNIPKNYIKLIMCYKLEFTINFAA